MNKSGHADMPLHGGRVPYWLAKRMAGLGGAITEAIVIEYGRDAFLEKLSDPPWFQSFGCVLGMDWHSSGITTSVMGALKKALNPMSRELGIYVCGGRGKHSLKTPQELLALGDKTGLDGQELVRNSKLAAKVDNTAIQDGYQLYLHNFIVTKEGNWSVVQQGLNNSNGMARRYHWNSLNLSSMVNEPHSAVCGRNQGLILNLSASDAANTRDSILSVAKEDSLGIVKEARKIFMPRRHEVTSKDIDLKRLGSVLALAQDHQPNSFDDLLLLKGLGPRTLQSLTLVSEVIHGTPSRFSDPARFSFAHGGKDGHPFPVPTAVYDETIETLKKAVNQSKITHSDKLTAIKSLHTLAQRIEKNFTPKKDSFSKYIQEERNNSYKYGGRTVFGKARSPKGQLSLF